MAHNIQERDAHYGIEQAWHGLTRIVEGGNITRENNWLGQWDIVAKPLFFADNKETPWQVFFASDDNLPIGNPFNPDSYTAIPNAAFLDCLYGFLEGTAHKVVSVGSVGNRSKLFCVIEFADCAAFKVGGWEVKPFGNLIWSHDKTLEGIFVNSATKTVCQNTVNANLALAKNAMSFRIRHTKNAASRIDNFGLMLENAVGVAAEMRQAMEELDAKPLDMDTARRAFAGFVAAPSGLSTRAAGTVDRLGELFVKGAGNAGKSRLDAFNAVTDYYSHESSGGEDKWKQFVSSEFGAGGNRKGEFARILLDDAKFDATIKRGDIALDARQKLLAAKAVALD